MEPTRDGLLEARRQLDSTIHKLKASIQSMEAKPHAARLRSQTPWQTAG